MGKHHCPDRKYFDFNYLFEQPGGKTLLTGVRGVMNNPKKVYLSGFYKPASSDQQIKSFVYKGKLNNPNKGKWFILNYRSTPEKSVTLTNLYGPNNGPKCNTIQVVGNYQTEQGGSRSYGCLYEGPLNGTGKWTTLIPTFADQDVSNVIAHSNMGGLVVGNYDMTDILYEGKAFIYDIKAKKYHQITKKGAKSITAYGIWYNGYDHWTICGGYSPESDERVSSIGYIVDWNNKTKEFANWTDYNFNNDPDTLITHFDGITSDGCGGYNLTGDYLIKPNNLDGLGFFVNISRKKSGKLCKHPKWCPITFNNSTGNKITSGNTVYYDTVIGVYKPILTEDQENGFISKIKC